MMSKIHKKVFQIKKEKNKYFQNIKFNYDIKINLMKTFFNVFIYSNSLKINVRITNWPR